MKIFISIATIGLRFIYFFIKILPTQHKVVMISRQANEPSIDFKLLKEALQKKDDSIKVVFLCRTLDGGINSSIMSKICYAFHMLKQMKEIATSEVVVLDTYCIVISLLKHKKRLKIIQMWHSMGTMKKFGYTALDTEEGTKKEIALLMHMHENYSYVLCSSPLYRDHLAKGFHCDEKIVKIFPLPRADLLRDEEYKRKKRNEIFERYPIFKEQQVIVYCPTFRKDEKEMQKAIDDLCNALHENQILVAKLHPLSKVCVSNPKVFLAKEFTSFEMLFAADALISDYSCIIYEAALLKIPLYFYNFDMHLYTGKRGLAIDYEKELPGPISKDARDLTRAIYCEKYDMQELEAFCNRYVVCHGYASDNLAEFILKLAHGEEENNGQTCNYKDVLE